MQFDKNQVLEQLKTYIDPYLQTDLVSIGVVKDIANSAGKTTIELMLGYPCSRVKEDLIHNLTNYLALKLGAVTIKLDWRIIPHSVQPGVVAIPNIKNIIAVASGKGGVGKSTTAVNLALALRDEGARVGILDADIYGPNQPQMLGARGHPKTLDEKNLLPIISHGIQSMSIGYLIEMDTAMIWRGPMVSSALQQLINETAWDNLDYLIIDLPPGTGDIQLTLAQKIPVSGAVIVTTPQEVALLDARKALKMFQKVNVPILGIIENMSVHICSHCGEQEYIFGKEGGQQMAMQFNIPYLGALPLAKSIREFADYGTPTVVAQPDSDIANSYRLAARKLAAQLSLRPKNFAAKFPKIVIEKQLGS